MFHITSNLALRTVTGNSVIPTIVLAHAPINTNSPIDGSSLSQQKKQRKVTEPNITNITKAVISIAICSWLSWPEMTNY